MVGTPGIALTTIAGGIDRQRLKGGANPNTLFDLLNGYVTQAGTVKVRPGTLRNANIAQYAGAGATKGLVAYQDQLHIFSANVVTVPPGYALHVLSYPPNSQISQTQITTPPTTAQDPYWADVTSIYTNLFNLNNGPYSALPGWGSGAGALSSGDFTVECWVTLASLTPPGGHGSTTQIIWSTGDELTNPNYLTLDINTSGETTFTGGDATNFSAIHLTQTSPGTITAGVSYHIACTRHGQVWSTWVNGVLSGANAQATATGSGALGAQGPDGKLGGSDLSTSQFTFMTGTIANFRVTKGIARYTAPFTVPTQPLPNAVISAVNPPIKEIHFAAPYLGGLYVVAEFAVSPTLAATLGSIFHFWIQSSTEGDNTNFWAANTDHIAGDIVIPTTPNGIIYVASRLTPPNPVWTPNTTEAVANIVEPTVANGFKYTVTVVEGSLPTTGTSEPVWPTSDGATVNENSALQTDQSSEVATAAPGASPGVPTKYTGNGPVFGS